ncbi:hypothetical protein N7493_011001 [Penicillium malachiteum]|uniref:Uncharacterized protein n=1 Tax=Penicillium malachiteum TaxID=1324776 RepID=A0AAD6HBC2_9EURO|nr:hypothetical protein N7493_011001 [Penicillium malachiteum]
MAQIKEAEAQTLSELYDPSQMPRKSTLDKYIDPRKPRVHKLLVESFASVGIAGGPTLHKEQEHQITHEVEREQQIYWPPKQKPLSHYVHEDIRYFVKYGQFPDNGTSAASLAFDSLRKTSLRQFDIPPSLGARLYATENFVKTVKRAKATVDDQFLKPVH